MKGTRNYILMEILKKKTYINGDYAVSPMMTSGQVIACHTDYRTSEGTEYLNMEEWDTEVAGLLVKEASERIPEKSTFRKWTN
ncbi:hypothetical protein CHS0354_023505 [Potamilus streckersoni]|uniref:Uncharacterized protein n=1 Tax=Potamilus streckersoni TaxID=2493646 RepID=A0AAE0RVA5_9BIVA|nr:hypothetical protein CHS0354_023505 [Potamilus streckersoni]